MNTSFTVEPGDGVGVFSGGNSNNNHKEADGSASTTKQPPQPQQQHLESADTYRLRPLGIDETFGRLMEIFRQRWSFYLAIAFGAVILQQLLSLTMGMAGRALGIADDSAVYYGGGGGGGASDYESIYEDIEDVTTAAEANGNRRLGLFYRHRWLEDAVAAAYGQDGDSTVEGGNDSSAAAISLPLLLASIAFSLAKSVLQYMVVAVSDGALIRSVAEVYVLPSSSSDRILSSARDVLARAWGRIIPLVGTLLFLSFGLGLPALVLFILVMNFVVGEGSFGLLVILALVWLAGACFVAVVTYLTYPIIMVENMPPRTIIGSFKRSWELSSGRRGYIMCVMVLFFIVQVILEGVIAAVVGVLGNNTYIAIALGLCFATFVTAVGAILQAIVYFSVRAAKERLTIDMLAYELQVDTETPYQSMTTTGDDNKMDMVNSGTNHGGSVNYTGATDGAAAPSSSDPSK